MATTAQQVDFLAAGVQHNGEPLSYGKVSTYTAGTSTPVSLYTASDKSANATNPIILDADGKATVYGDAEYKFVITDANDQAVVTFDNFSVRLSSTVSAGFTLDNNVFVKGKDTGATPRNLIGMNASDETEVGASTQKIKLSHSEVSAVIKLANAIALQAKETGGTARNLISMNGSNEMVVGDTAKANYLRLYGSNIILHPDGGGVEIQTTQAVKLSNGGRILLNNNKAYTGYTTTSAEYNIGKVNASDDIEIGHTGVDLALVGANITLNGNTVPQIRNVAATAIAYWNGLHDFSAGNKTLTPANVSLTTIVGGIAALADTSPGAAITGYVSSGNFVMASSVGSPWYVSAIIFGTV